MKPTETRADNHGVERVRVMCTSVGRSALLVSIAALMIAALVSALLAAQRDAPYRSADSASVVEGPRAHGASHDLTVRPAARVDGIAPGLPTSPAPSWDEWKAAPEAADIRVTDGWCVAKHIREHIYVECSSGVAMAHVAGDRAGMSFRCPRQQPDETWCEFVAVSFPMRPGQTRVVQNMRWSKWGPTPDAVISAHWLEGESAPQITVQGIRWGF